MDGRYLLRTGCGPVYRRLLVPVKPFSCNGFPGHALHEKGLQRQQGVGPLASSQERRAVFVTRINRVSTAYQPVVNRTFCSSTGLNRMSLVGASERRSELTFNVELVNGDHRQTR